MVKRQLKAVEPREDNWKDAMHRFGQELSRTVAHPKTPRVVKSALEAVIVNTISNETSYQWIHDEEALAFLIPRFLLGMEEGYALGLIHALDAITRDVLPHEVREEIRKGDVQ